MSVAGALLGILAMVTVFAIGALMRLRFADPPSVLTKSQGDQVIALLTQIKEATMALSPDMQRIADNTAKQTTIIASLKTLIAGVVGQIRSNADDAAAMRGIADQLEQNDADLAKVVTDNTPSAPTPPAPVDTSNPTG